MVGMFSYMLLLRLQYEHNFTVQFVQFCFVFLLLGKSLQQLKSLVADKGDLGIVAEVSYHANNFEYDKERTINCPSARRDSFLVDTIKKH